MGNKFDSKYSRDTLFITQNEETRITMDLLTHKVTGEVSYEVAVKLYRDRETLKIKAAPQPNKRIREWNKRWRKLSEEPFKNKEQAIRKYMELAMQEIRS